MSKNFDWNSVKMAKDRDLYLGISTKSTIGLANKHKDFLWYTKGKPEMKQTERDEINRLQKIARLEALGLPVPPELRAPPTVTQDVLNILNTPGTKPEHQEGERYEGVGTTTEPQLDVVREKYVTYDTKDRKRTRNEEERTTEHSRQRESSARSRSHEDRRSTSERSHHHHHRHHHRSHRDTRENSDSEHRSTQHKHHSHHSSQRRHRSVSSDRSR